MMIALHIKIISLLLLFSLLKYFKVKIRSLKSISDTSLTFAFGEAIIFSYNQCGSGGEFSMIWVSLFFVFAHSAVDQVKQ